MKKEIKYTRGPNIGEVRIVKDFLPPPHMLVFSPELEKVTIVLTKRSIDFFKAEAEKHGFQYQRMIRVLLDQYSQTHSVPEPPPVRRKGKKARKA
jgi:hypothetical protein